MANYENREIQIPQGLGTKIVGVGIVLIALIVLAKTFGTVQAGERGVLLRFGEVVSGGTIEPGLYVMVPFMDRVVMLPTQIQKYTAPATASSKDLQVVSTEVTLNYQLNASQVGEI